jgi:serine/threonine protein kinase
MPQPLSVVELEDLLGPHLHNAEAGRAPPLLLAHRYMVQKIVGKGARGLVCKGRDVRLDRDIAVKLYPADPALIREVEGEAKALARLRHPNIIGVYDAGQAEFQLGEQSVSCLLLAMEFVEGTNARVWLQRADRHPRAIVALFLAAGDGLAAAHAAATVHRDIKPENIMVDVHGVPRVVDFGLARPAPASPAAPAGPGHTQFGTITGTLEYMAPEARGGLADERSDQFSFAVALWEALTGRLPYDPHRGEWRLADSPDFHGAELLPRRLATPLRRALSHSAGKRHRDLAALLDALRRAEARRTAWLVWGAAATLAVLAVIWQSSTATADPEPARPSSTTVATVDPPAPTPTSAPVPAVAREAFLAYLATIRAYNRHDEDGYFAGFLAPMDCFYSVPGADVRARRKKLAGYIEVSESDLELISTDGASTVTFCERGLFDYESGRGRVRHGKAIVMRKVDGAWKIAVETTRKHTECFVSPCAPRDG